MTWTTLATPPFRVGAAATDGTTVWLHHDFDDQFQSYNPVTDTYTALATPPFPCGVDQGGMIYDPAGPAIWVLTDGSSDCVDEIFRYDIGSNTWSAPGTYTKHPTTSHRSIAEAAWVRLGRKVYAAGGYLSASPFQTNETWSYDLDTDTWTQLADMPFTLAELQAAANDDETAFYAYGVWNDDLNDYLPEGYSYLPSIDTWVTLGTPEYSADTAGYPVVVRIASGPFVIVGGFGNDRSDEAWVHDLGTDTWVQQDAVPFNSYMQGVAVGNTVIVWRTYSTLQAASLDLSSFEPPVPPPTPYNQLTATWYPYVDSYPSGEGTDLTALAITFQDPLLELGGWSVTMRSADETAALIQPDDYVVINIAGSDGIPVPACVGIVDDDDDQRIHPDEEKSQTRTFSGPLILGRFKDGAIEPPNGVNVLPIVDDVHYDYTHPEYDWSGESNATDITSVWYAVRDAGGAFVEDNPPLDEFTPHSGGRWGYLSWFTKSMPPGNITTPPDTRESTRIIGPADGTIAGTTTAPGDFYLGGDPFTTWYEGDHLYFLTADNGATLFIDGAEIASAGLGDDPHSGHWSLTQGKVYLTAGTHYPTIKLTNEEAPFGAPNPTGVAASIYVPSYPVLPNDLIWETTTSMKIIERPAETPGMSPCMAARLYLESHQANGRFTGWGLTCTDGFDTDGAAWAVTPVISVRVGSDDGLALFLKIMEAYADVRILTSPGQQVSMWNKDAYQPSSGVTFAQAVNLTSLRFHRQRMAADELLLRSQFGWSRAGSAGGRRQGTFTFGPENTFDEVTRLAIAELAYSSQPRDETDFSYQPLNDTELPYVNTDFVPGSLGTIPTRAGGTASDRCVWIEGTWNDSEKLTIRVRYKDRVLQEQERILRLMKALGG